MTSGILTTAANAVKASLIVLVLLSMAGTAMAELQVFGSFEDQAEVQSIRSSTGTKVTVSTRFPAWEANSLEVVFPAGGGFIETRKVPADWRRQESLLVFAWSLQPSELSLVIRDDAGHEFSKHFQVRSGVNHLQLPLNSVTGIDLRTVAAVEVQTKKPGSFYFDYFALDRFHPVLEERGRWDINYSMEVETPHVRWARPLAGGPVKVFAIADVADGRGVVELAQRLELDFKATTIGASPGINKWGFGDFYEQRSGGGEFWQHAYSLAHAYLADDLIYGPRYDVILWPGIRPWNSYPAEVRDALRRRVEEGTGLVLFDPTSLKTGDSDWNPSPLLARSPRSGRDELDRSRWQPVGSHYITRGVPWEAFPWGEIGVPESTVTPDVQVLLKTGNGNPVIAVHQVGKGRVVTFAYSEKGMIPAVKNIFETGLHYSYHEYFWALLARAVVWASRREPAATIQQVDLDKESARVQVRKAAAGSAIRAAVRSGYDELEMDGKTVPVTNGQAVLPLPAATSGLQLIELQLLDGEKVVDWAATTRTVAPKVRVKSVIPASDRVKVGETVPVKVALSASMPTRCTLTVSLYDNLERLLDRRSFPLAAETNTEQSVNLRTIGALTHLARIDCEVSVDGQRSDRRTAEVFVLQPRSWGDYDIVMYRFGPDPIPGIWPVIDRQMRRLEVTTLSSYSLTHSKHANYNIQAQTRISGQESPDGPARKYYSGMKRNYLASQDKSVLVREFCLDDPGYRELISQELERLTAPWVPFSPMSYYVYEEPSLTCYGDAVDICFCPHTMRGMRNWLKGVYGSLDRLNEQWGTNFTDWDSVVPDDASEAQARGNYSSWADHRTYMETVYADTYRFALEKLRNSGTQISGSHNGCDYSRLNQYTRHLNAYEGGNQLDFHRCFNPDVKISGGAGYGVLGKDVFYNFYSNLFKGANGGAYIFWQYSTLDPDLTMSQSGKDMEQGFRELRGEGIGKLVGLATPENNGIAVHYSYPSIHAAWIVDGKVKEEVSYHASASFDRFAANRDGWVKILKDSGLQLDFLAYGDLEKGALREKGYKVFVLPMSYALSDKEVAAIRDFVQAGGTLIADGLPGIMDEHCRFRSKRPLLDVFGIEADVATPKTIVDGVGEPGLALKGAHALSSRGNRLLVNRFGKGKAYLLNFFLDTYPEDRLEKRSGPLLADFAKVLADAQIVPVVRLVGAQGEAVAQCSTYVFNNGTTRLVGIVPDMLRPGIEKAQLRFDGKKAIYDVRAKKYVGTGSSFEVTLEPGVPSLFALVADPVGEMSINVPSSAVLGEEIRLRFGLSGIEDFRSVAKVVVTDPNGNTVRYYGGNRDILAGKGQTAFRTALNDPPGRWKVEVTDVISGHGKTAEIEVKSSPLQSTATHVGR